VQGKGQSGEVIFFSQFAAAQFQALTAAGSSPEEQLKYSYIANGETLTACTVL